MEFRMLAIFTLTLAMSGCGLFKTSSYVPQPLQTNEAYEPLGKEPFVMNSKAYGHNRSSYWRFCEAPSSDRCWPVDYSDYVGKPGYFKTGEPVTDKTGAIFYEVILSGNFGGRRLFLNAGSDNVKIDGIELVTPKQWEEQNVFVPKPLFEGSPVSVVAFDHQYEVFTLSTGEKRSQNDLDTLRDLFTKYRFTPKAMEMLHRFQLTYEAEQDRYYIEPFGFYKSSDYRPYIGLSGNQKWLRVKLWYFGRALLKATSYDILADNYRWESPPSTFGRAYYYSSSSDPDMWLEWTDAAWSETEMATATALANAQSAVIHFKGVEHPQLGRETLSQGHKDTIKVILELYSEIGVPAAPDGTPTAGPCAREER